MLFNAITFVAAEAADWRLIMKKRLLCLILALVMAMAVCLTSCSSDDDENADVDEVNAQTITMRLISEKKVCNTDAELAAYLADECGGDETDEKYLDMLDTKKAYDAVEAAFTKITKSKYKINVDLLFYTAEEYFGAEVDDPSTEEDETVGLLESTMEKYALEAKEKEIAERTLDKYIADYQAAFPEANYPKARLAMEFFKYYPEHAKFENELSVFENDDEYEDDKIFEEQYQENELGIKELVYPATGENQLDIIYLSGLDMYNTYIENEWLTALDSYIATSGSKLNDYITGALLNGVKVDGATYAIPNNIQIGEYTYMLIDKELFDTYYYNSEDITSVLDCKNFLEDIALTQPDVIPLDASFKECMDLFVWYWNIDCGEDEFGDNYYSINTDNEFSIVGKVYGDPAKVSRGKIELGFNSLFADANYREIFLALKDYEFNGYYAKEDDTREKAAVSFVNGTYAIKKAAMENEGVYTDEKGKEYYAYVVKYPEADESSLYGNMYAVSANSQHTSACIQVLTLLNTNSELRNILQYGIKGVNYVIDEDTNTLRRLNDDYVMDIEKTGNCFIAYPEEGLPMDYWENSKKQNNDALIDPLLGFDFNDQLADYDAVLANKLLENVGILTANVLADIEDCQSYDELYELICNSKTGIAKMLETDCELETPEGIAIVRIKKLTNKLYDTAVGEDGEPDNTGESPYAVYYNWMETYGFVPSGS